MCLWFEEGNSGQRRVQDTCTIVMYLGEIGPDAMRAGN